MVHEIVSKVNGIAVDYPGKFAKATITANGKTYDLTPNQLGNYQRVDIAPSAKVQVQVTYPKAQEGDPVAVSVMDGGHLNKGEMSEVAKLDGSQSLQFQFQATDQKGIYRIVLRNGADVKTVNFWVGAEPLVRE